jgi:hypothetical protein
MGVKLPAAQRWIPWSLVVALAVLLLAGSIAPVSSGTGPAETDEVAVAVPLEPDDEAVVLLADRTA